jgi:hypothetical protein
VGLAQRANQLRPELIADAAAPLLPRLDRGEPRPGRGRRRGAYFQYAEQLTRGGHASEKDSRQLAPARAPPAARERRAWALVVPPALFGLLGFAIHLPAAGYPCYWYPVVPIALWLAVLGMSASSARSDTALT